MNKERILAVADAIEAHPQEFTMVDWCGTACCIAGWAMKMYAPEKETWYLNDAAEVLGLGVKEANSLFLADWTEKLLVEITAAETATYLRELAK